MTSLLALTLSATLSNTPAPPPQQPSLLTQTGRIAQGGAALRGSRPSAALTRARFAPPGGDSLKDGAIKGAVTGGIVAGAFIYWLCNALDEHDNGGCEGPSLLFAAGGAAAGALLGTGIDALFDRPRFTPRMARPQLRMRVRF